MLVSLNLHKLVLAMLLRTIPRMLVASIDMRLSCSNFESHLRDALAGKTELSRNGQLPDSGDAKAGWELQDGWGCKSLSQTLPLLADR